MNVEGRERTLRWPFVPSQKKDRQWVSSRARAAAIEAARRRQMRRRLLGAVGAGVLVIALIAAVAFRAGGGSTKTASTPTTAATNSTTTTAPLPSAAGKPCVPLADPLPTGSPDVPIQTGPPPTQIVKQDLKEGTGDPVTASQTVEVNYTGVSCSTGKIFDSSYQRGKTATFPLSNVIKGWQEGIPGMKVGGQRLLGVPPELAYGSNPPETSGIAPDETLWFIVEMISAK